MQGCVYPDLRTQAAKHIASYDSDGIAIGGLAVGEKEETMYEMIEVVNAVLPKNKPRYLMGVGTPVNILEAIDRGVDMFDCVMPTRTEETECYSRKKESSTFATKNGNRILHLLIRMELRMSIINILALTYTI